MNSLIFGFLTNFVFFTEPPHYRVAKTETSEPSYKTSNTPILLILTTKYYSYFDMTSISPLYLYLGYEPNLIVPCILQVCAFFFRFSLVSFFFLNITISALIELLSKKSVSYIVF